MRTLLVLPALALLVATAVADQTREDYVWAVAHNRIVPQMDNWFNDGDFPRCIQLLRLMHELDPHDYTTTTDLGWMLGNVEQEGDELALYKDYKNAYPLDPEAAYPEAEFYFLKKQYAKVPPIIAPTIDRKPHPNSYRILAHAYESLGNLVEAKAVWEKLIAVYPDEPAIATSRLNLARVEKKLEKAGSGK
jgi:tetratricopeptide (TPR) repeat protein